MYKIQIIYITFNRQMVQHCPAVGIYIEWCSGHSRNLACKRPYAKD